MGRSFQDWKLFLGLFGALSLVACGGGSSGGGDDTDNGDTINNEDDGTDDGTDGDTGTNDDSVDEEDSGGGDGTDALSGQVFTFERPVISSSRAGTPNNATAAALGPQGQIHLAWSAPTSDDQTNIHYGVFDGQNFNSVQVTQSAHYGQRSPDLVVDAMGQAHIVWHLRRTEDNLFNSGNFAIRYASGGLNGFDVGTVSEDLADPTADADGEFYAYVNGRPSITLSDNDTPLVFWLADSNAATDYDKRLVRASRAGGGWDREVLFDPQEVHADDRRTVSVSDGFAVARPWSSEAGLGWIDISDYLPWLATPSEQSWATQALDQDRGVFAADHLQVEAADNGDLHYLWRTETESGDPAAARAIRTDSDIQTELTPIEHSVTGNFLPATIDPATGEAFYVYAEGALGSSSGRYLLRDGTAYELNTEGVTCGRRSLLYASGQLVHATCDMDGEQGRLHFTVIDLDNLGEAGGSDDPEEPSEPDDTDTTTLSSNVPVTDLAGGTDSQAYYTLEVPTGAANVIVDTAEGSGDLDLYLFDPSGALACSSDYSGNAETCIVSEPTSGTWTVEVFGYSDYSGARLVGYSRAHTGDAGDITGLADIVGTYDWSDEYEGGVTDEWYLTIDGSGNISDYDYQGDDYDQGSNCYVIDRDWEQLGHISANRFSTQSLGEVTTEVVLDNLVIIPVYDTENYFIIGPEVSRSKSDMTAAEC